MKTLPRFEEDELGVDVEVDACEGFLEVVGIWFPLLRLVSRQ